MRTSGTGTGGTGTGGTGTGGTGTGGTGTGGTAPGPGDTLHDRAATAIGRLTAVVPDFPSPGVIFRDLTPVFADSEAFRTVVDALAEPFAGTFDAVAGVEARGFLLAAAVAYATGTGVVAIRKAGKLPRPVHRESYDLEYGRAALEIHRSDLPAGSSVLVLDDVLATGGSLAAACALLERAGAAVVGCGVVLELGELGGRRRLAGRTVRALEIVGAAPR